MPAHRALQKGTEWLENLSKNEKPAKIFTGMHLEAVIVFGKRAYMEGYLQALRDIEEKYAK